VNAIGPLLLYQAVKGFLVKSRKSKFVAVSSIVSSIGLMENFQGSGTAYGVSKAALNYISSKIYYENKELIVCVIHPGYV
jgi:norsolorinic acid ketoreductase